MFLISHVTSRDHLFEGPCMRLYGWKILFVCRKPATFGGHRRCGSGDVMFLVYQVTSYNHVFEGPGEVMGETSSFYVTIQPHLVTF